MADDLQPEPVLSYREEVAPAPYNDPAVPHDAAALMRFSVADGLVRSVRAFSLIADTSPLGFARWGLNSSEMIAGHDRYLLLEAIRELDPAKADEIAERIIVAAEAGDSYGEWLWQWATELGLDADRLYDGVEAEEVEVHPVGHVVMYRDEAGEWRWAAISRNNVDTVADSGEGYVDRSDCESMARRMFPGVEIRNLADQDKPDAGVSIDPAAGQSARIWQPPEDWLSAAWPSPDDDWVPLGTLDDPSSAPGGDSDG